MKPVKHVNAEPTPAKASIDYDRLRELYNEAPVGGGVEMDRVYNISLFKQALVRRGLVPGKDVDAFTSGEQTIVKRTSTAVMTRG